MLPLSLAEGNGKRRRGTSRSVAWVGQQPANSAIANDAHSRTLVVWLTVFAALALAIALAHVWLRLQVRDVGYRRSATLEIIEKLEKEGEELKAEIACLEAPDRLEEVARVRLGMVRAELGQEVVLP